MVVGGIFSAIDPLLLRWLIDDALPNRRLEIVLAIASAFLLVRTVQATASAIGSLSSVRAGQMFKIVLRKRLLVHLGRLSSDYHAMVPAGEQQYYIERDVEGISDVLNGVMIPALGVLMSMASALVAVAFLNPQLAWLIIPTNCIYVLLHRRFLPRLRDVAEKSQVQAGISSSSLVEYIAAICQIQILGIHRRQARIVVRGHLEAIRAEYRQKLLEARFGSYSIIVIAVATSVTLAFAGYQVVRGELSAGALIASYSYLLRLLDPAGAICGLLTQVTRLTVHVRRVQEVLAAKPTVCDAEVSLILLRKGGFSLEFRDVQFAYGVNKQNLLCNVQLQVQPGEKVGLAGPSGSGKTTIGRLIARQYDVRSGIVAINGYDIRDIALSCLRAIVGYVPQQPQLFNGSVRENLLIGDPSVNESELNRILHITCLKQFAGDLHPKLDSASGTRGGSLSGGERQRVAIARAILRKPNILVLDEATSALDAHTEREIVSNLLEAYPLTTMVFISHRREVLSLMDRVVHLVDGVLASEPRGLRVR